MQYFFSNISTLCNLTTLSWQHCYLKEIANEEWHTLYFTSIHFQNEMFYILFFFRVLASHNRFCTKGIACNERDGNDIDVIKNGFKTDLSHRFLHEKYNQLCPRGGKPNMRSNYLFCSVPNLNTPFPTLSDTVTQL